MMRTGGPKVSLRRNIALSAVEYTNGTLQKGEITTNEYPGYDTKSSESEAPELDIWGMWNAPSLPLFPGSL